MTTPINDRDYANAEQDAGANPGWRSLFRFAVYVINPGWLSLSLGSAMTPSRAQYFFARLWLVHTWSAGVTLLCVIAAIRASGVTTSSLREWPLVLWLLGIVLVSALIGWFAALLFGWFLFGPLYFARGQKNGAPFRVGDHVHILVGAHRDAVVRVYEVWESRNQVRVELGDDEKKKVRDVFSYYEICRASAA